jgi:hypothetical protein
VPTPTRPRALTLTLAASFAVLNFIAEYLPFTPVIGVPGAFFHFSWIVSPLTGILLGPVLGGASCFIASGLTLALGVQQWIIGPLTPFRTLISAVQAGLLASGRWEVSSTLLGTLVVLWLALPAGRDAAIVVIFHVAGLFAVLATRSRTRSYLSSTDRNAQALGFAIAAYCGNISRHLFSNLLFAALEILPPTVFIAVIPLTGVEQSLFAAATSIIGTAAFQLGIQDKIPWRSQ